MAISSSELPLQILYLDGQILVVCAGPCGEAFVFIKKPEVERLFKESFLIHRQIDRIVKPSKNIPRSQHKKLTQDLRRLGEFLFEQIFQDKILDLFNVTIGQAIRLNTSVVIRLMIVTDFLNIIPWELLCDKGTYLCHTYDLLRHPFAIQPVRRPLSIDSNLRVLFVGANPGNDILVRDQLEAVMDAISSIQANLTCLTSTNRENSSLPTYTNIANEIYKGKDILHFLAHGEYILNAGKEQGYFLIDAEGENKADKLPVEMLQSFCRASPMQLAILSACRSDQAIKYSARSMKRLQTDGYYSMAHALIRVGVPCVIGMSHPISKFGAGILVKRLYYVLVEQRETINKAVRQARLELFAHMDDLLPSDWMTLVLYSRISVPAIELDINYER